MVVSTLTSVLMLARSIFSKLVYRPPRKLEPRLIILEVLIPLFFTPNSRENRTMIRITLTVRDNALAIVQNAGAIEAKLMFLKEAAAFGMEGSASFFLEPPPGMGV